MRGKVLSYHDYTCSSLIRLVAFNEFINYLVKTDGDFHRDYVAGNKSWF